MFALVGKAVGGIYQVLRGLTTVARHSGRPPTTKEFPDIMPQLPGAFRGRLALAVNPETGEHLCISCRQCERVCPDKCIEITAHKSPETGKLELIDFRIDHGLCMFCGLCTEVCPTNCIINTNDFEMSEYSRGALIYDLKRLTLTQEESAHYFGKKELPLPKPKPAKAPPKPAPAAGAEKPAAAAKSEGPEKPAAGAEKSAAATTAGGEEKPGPATGAERPAAAAGAGGEEKPAAAEAESERAEKPAAGAEKSAAATTAGGEEKPAPAAGAEKPAAAAGAEGEEKPAAESEKKAGGQSEGESQSSG